MTLIIRKYNENDLIEMTQLWNDIVEEGNSFPQEEKLTEQTAKEFFSGQSYTGVADDNGMIVGLYILHPNNVGRCSHISNASYAVKSGQRGRHIGESLVKDSIEMAKKLSFRILQFNAVVATNTSAIHLYKKLGFQQLGTIPRGFRLKDNTYVDIIPFFIEFKFIDNQQKRNI